MAENPDKERQTFSNSNRRNFRSSSTRNNDPHRPNYNKAYQNFGVRDLRELLDKRHLDEEQQPLPSKGAGPPPDPPYNYLRDPLRENEQQEKTESNSIVDHPPRSRSHPDQKFRGRGRGGRGRGGFDLQKTTPIVDPINIKVEFSTETGKRNYILDESVKLAEIKHVPDRGLPGQRGSFRGAPNRGRGQRSFRERGRRGQRGRRSKSEGRVDGKDVAWPVEKGLKNEEGKVEEAKPGEDKLHKKVSFDKVDTIAQEIVVNSTKQQNDTEDA